MITSTTPTLLATARDVDILDGGEPTRFQAEVWQINGSAAVVSGYAPYAPQDAGTAWKVPAGALVAEATYKWRAKGDDGTALSPEWSDWCEFTIDSGAESAYIESLVFFKALNEHLLGSGPTPSESQMHVTSRGRELFDALASDQDEQRTGSISEGVTPSAVNTDLVYQGGVSQTSDEFTFTPTVSVVRADTIAGTADSWATSETWTVGLKKVAGQ